MKKDKEKSEAVKVPQERFEASRRHVRPDIVLRPYIDMRPVVGVIHGAALARLKKFIPDPHAPND